MFQVDVPTKSADVTLRTSKAVFRTIGVVVREGSHFIRLVKRQEHFVLGLKGT